MKTVLLVATALLAISLAAPAVAEPQWLPVCKDKDFRVGPYVWVHVGIDCYPGVWVQVCAPGQPCRVYDVGTLS